jgi:hypothetical protein
MQLLKELTREWQLDSWYQPGRLDEGSPIMQLLKDSHQRVAAGQLLSDRLDWLEEWIPTMQLLKELTRVWQLESCYQPSCGYFKRKPYHAAAEETRQCGSWTAAISQAVLHKEISCSC